MAISAVQAGTAIQKNEAAAGPQRPPNAAKQQSLIPQDKLTISPEAEARQAAAAAEQAKLATGATDRDQDGDRR